LVVVYGFVDSHKDMNINKFRMPTTKHFFKGVKCETFKVVNFVIYWWWMQRSRCWVRFASSTWNVSRFWNTNNKGLQLFQKQVKKATQKSIHGFT